ncbi:T6SS immunity protein Tli4 family protein [Pseudoduganella violaceinigra]|uniref:T6SS immunity protein Tli4 family protein n=1 Tax=Pseudoduganella violaceinigra TaxID=246602 RepID=UPI0013777C4D|nr:T6SS immunity protein Tli4 family protein [Pseudoduganella violaceinigra]
MEPANVVCIGRVLVDMPTSLITTYGMTYFAGWHINTSLESDEKFEVRLRDRIRDLENARNAYGSRSLEFLKAVNGELEGTIFQFDRESLKVVEGGVVSHKDIVKIEAYLHGHGISFDISGGVRHENEIGQLEDLIRNMRVREPGDVLSKNGFCFDRGIILGSENPTLSEGVTVFAGDPTSNDIAVVIDSSAGARATDTLLQRTAASSIRKEYPSSFKNLRIGTRRINEHLGEEVLTRVIEDDGRSNHSFMWESTPVKQDIYHPQITMELSTGHNNNDSKKTPFTDEEAIALWDRITMTLRTRPASTSQNSPD